MNWLLFFAVFFILFGGIFSIATSSIAIECYNKNEEHKRNNSSNFGFLTINLITAIIIVLISFILLYYIMFRNLGSSVSFGKWVPAQQMQPQMQQQPPSYQQAQTGGKWKMKMKRLRK
jgi:MFS family permease